jgi:hypothetical protein
VSLQFSNAKVLGNEKKKKSTLSEMLRGVNVSKCYPLRITYKTAQVITATFYYKDKQG